MAIHTQIIVETFSAVNEPSVRPIRVRPLEGQGFPTSWRVKFSVAERFNCPVGTMFKVWVTVSDPGPHLRASRPYTKVGQAEAASFIQERFSGSPQATC